MSAEFGTRNSERGIEASSAPIPHSEFRIPHSVVRSFYLLMGTVAVAIAVAKVVGAENVYEPSRYTAPPGGYSKSPPEPPRNWPATRPEPTPMFSSNDRSRWATVRALVDGGTYRVGERVDDPRLPAGAALGSVGGYAAHRTRVAPATPPGLLDRGIIFEPDYQSLDKVMDPDTGEFYSSKPPLMPTLIAAEYWLLKRLLGWSIVADRWPVMCTILLTVNVAPFAVYLLLLGWLLDDYGTSDFGRLFTFTAAGCGTFLTTFSATLNNHVPAAFCALFAVYPLLRKAGRPPTESPVKLLVSGFFAGLLATLEFPAAALVAGLLVPTLLARPRAGLTFLAGVLVPVAALFATNYAAIGRLLPAYTEFGGPWYNYPGSHWAKVGTPAAKGIDFADEPKEVYAFHLLVGHHGWFSLTPVWLLGAAGLAGLAWAARGQVGQLLRRRMTGEVWTPALLGAVTVAVSAVVFGFYVWRTNNYGGFTSGPRWLFWLTPLWLLGTLPAADRVGRYRAGRLLAAGLLGLSVLSVFYPAWNPWRPPWVLQLLEVNDWVRY